LRIAPELGGGTDRDVMSEVEHADRRLALARLRLDFELLKFELGGCKAGFDPNQPRAPAGGPDGGQWTSGDGIEGGDPEILSDVTPDDNWSPDAHYAQNDSLAGYPIDLNDERARGGHTIERHVNRTPDTLIAQALEAFETRPNAQDSRSGSFSSLEAATKLVNSTLAQNRAIIDEIASGARPHAVVFARFGSVTGIEAVAPNIRAQPYIRETHGVGVVVVHDRSSPRGYTVWTAFPSNR
jgi:hypothetical protein